MVKRRYSILCVMFAILIGFSGIAFSQQTTYAKEKVTKVTYTTKTKNYKECMIVKGLSSKRKFFGVTRHHTEFLHNVQPLNALLRKTEYMFLII